MIDELDRKLIQELQKSGRQSYVDLARMLGVVEGTVRKRVKDLQNRKIIKIVAVPNPRELGYSFISIMGLQVRMADLRKVADDLAQKPNVCYLAFVTGRYDLMAIIMTRSSEELSHFIETEISAIPSILRTETFVNLDIIKGGAPWLDTTQLISNLDTLFA
ncbi:Lrp/AsnC family transcriptional regulator [Dehalococcoidia bacterium]|nr:Lrp/AsnC family transcriptional regulator [Dehalococcoidia bacterium]